MRKIIITLVCLLTICVNSAQAATGKLRQGVMMYKSGNFVGCMQTMQDIVSSDPGNAFAHYYLAMSYVRVGKVEDAKKEYQSVLALNSSAVLNVYAKQGLANIDPSSTTSASATSSTPSSSSSKLPEAPSLGTKPAASGATTGVYSKIKEQKLESIKQMLNNGSSVDPNMYKNLDNNKSDSSTPNGEEVKKALAVLSQAGLNQYSNPYASTDMAQLGLMMSATGGMGNLNNAGGANNSYMNMLPMMLMQQSNSGKKIDPQLMQTVVSSMMMPNMFSSFNDSGNGNY